MSVPAGPLVIAARSEEGNRELVKKLRAVGVPADGVPTIQFVEPASWTEVDEALGSLDGFDWIVFTSPRAVASVSARMSKLRLSVPSRTPRLAAVGPATAEAARRAGFGVDHIPDEYLTSSLAESLPSGSGSRVVLFRTDIGDKRLPATLERRGFTVRDLTVYETRAVEGQLGRGTVSTARIVVFASPSEVRGFRERMPPEDFALVAQKAVAACIGPVTADAARDAGFAQVVVPQESSVAALVAKVKEAFQGA